MFSKFTFADSPKPTASTQQVVSPAPLPCRSISSGTAALPNPWGPPTAITPKVTRKRSNTGKENHRPAFDDPVNTPTAHKKRKYTPRQTTSAKLEAVFQAIDDARWTLGDFLHYTFRMKDDDAKDISRSPRHAQVVSRFLQGLCAHTPAMILNSWFHSPDGRISTDSHDANLMYSTKTPYTEIKPVRAALTSFAVQIVESKLVKEARQAVKPSSGLHATSRRKGARRVEWLDVGATTVSRVAGLIQLHQPLTWHYMMCISEPESRPSQGEVAVHRRRPPATVCTHAISALNFARNNEARLLPLARGLLYFAFSAPIDLIAYNSRIGEMPAYSTISRALKGLSDHEATITLAHGRNPIKCGMLQFDNVQNYLRQRDPRIGRENKMNVGLAATYIELEAVDPDAFDADDKQKRIAEAKREKLTVEQLYSMIDFPHIEVVCVLHWLRILTHYVPELEKWKNHVSMLFETRAKRIQLPIQPSKVHPLASSGKNETVTTELKDALLDFFSQLGQTHEDYLRRLILVGGDGLTYEKMVQLKVYMQFHDDIFTSFQLLQPSLAGWHTEWTNLSRDFETHWDSLLSMDPSTLGHSAAQIGRAAPSNLKKVDYYPCAELLFLVLDVRILDCWRLHFSCDDLFDHFRGLSAIQNLPEFEDLEAAALKLHRKYSTTRAHYLALHELDHDSEWVKSIPPGSPWVPPLRDESSICQPQPQTTGPKKAGTRGTRRDMANVEQFKGDHVLANSIALMRDALISREMAYAIAEGDVGRMYEMMKFMLFTFAGSSHTKYTNYLLEMLCDLELESSPLLREAVLRSMLVNLSGQRGAFSASDFIQEFFNRLLEAIVEKKGVDYGDTFIRNVISRNLHHFARIKLDLRNGVGLARRSGRHTAPHLKPEIRTLLNTYSKHELHSHCPGRIYEHRDVDDFRRGILKLGSGKLKKWVMDTTRTRGLNTPLTHESGMDPGEEGLDDDEDLQELDHDAPIPRTAGFTQVVDGELVIDMTDDSENIDGWIELFDSDQTTAMDDDTL
ncbi:hypothetical protein BD779DRAFT_1708992 [Infundibulicybe gibba]|nr:hypothetical protein BD779DRAFT_1708992 [Infundibulicybe gibba]